MIVLLSLKVFTREATGLVRNISVLDSLGVGLAAFGMSGPLLFYFDFMSSFPNDNPIMAVVIASIIVIIQSLALAMVATVFPRNGGDYVFNSRILHPTIGIMVDLLRLLTTPFSFAFYTISSIVPFSDMLIYEGLVTNNPSLAAAGNFLLLRNVEFIVTTTLLVVTMLFFVERIRAYYHVQTWFNLGAILAILVVAAFCLVTPNSVYQTEFTHFFHVDYNSVILAASKAGLSVPVVWGAFPTLIGTSYLLFYIPTSWPTAVAGEMRNPGKSLYVSVLGAQIIGDLLFLIVGVAAIPTFGRTFTTSAAVLAYAGTSPFHVTPYGSLLDLAAPMFGNPALLAIIFIVVTVANFFSGPLALLVISRKLFAWSFDRLIPSKFADVSPRFGVPVYSSIAIGIIAEVYTVLVLYGHFLYSIINGVGVIKHLLILGVGSLSPVLLPLRKDLFKQAPPFVQKKLGSVPIISVIGAVAFVGIMALLLFGQLIPAAQALGGRAANVAATFILFFAGLPFYYLVKRYRKTQGIDLGLAYAQIPPE